MRVSAKDSLALQDYRRQMHFLYASIRDTQQDPEGGFAHFKARRDDLFRMHPQSALTKDQKTSFRGLNYFPYDPQLRFEISPLPLRDQPIQEIALEMDGPFQFQAIATLAFAVQGQDCQLHLFQILGYAGGLFLPFRDTTNGKETYGGGRYLLDTMKGADLGTRRGKLVLDLNFAYNPSCAYHPRWHCPLAPQENWLDVPIRAGEMNFTT